MTIEEYLKQYQRSKKISFAEIGRKCGISKQMISKIVNGQIKRVSGETLVKIAKGTGIDIADFVKLLDLEVEPQTGGETLRLIREQREQISDEMYFLYTAYRRADEDTRKAIRLLLRMEE